MYGYVCVLFVCGGRVGGGGGMEHKITGPAHCALVGENKKLDTYLTYSIYGK